MSFCPTKKPGTLRVLHTSDWHLGKRLYHQSRYDEFANFLDWLLDTINKNQVDILLVAGDIFDTMNPSNRAQELYYQFLASINQSCCQHVVIIAGNHDSPSLLEAPKTILQSLNIQVIGAVSDNPQDELLVLYNQQQPIAIVLAVPYLRDKDVRTSGFADNNSHKEQQTTQGIAKHYQKLANLAKDTQKKLQSTYQTTIPVIAMGHLFVTGCHTSSSDDGMRELYVGTLGQISASIFDDCFDYVALGHIHAPQQVGTHLHIRYSGSPIAMGFGEASKAKQVLIVDFNKSTPTIYPVSVPVFQQLMRITGDWQTIEHTLATLIVQQQSIWVEIIYTGKSLEPNLVSNIYQLLSNTQIQALNIQNKTLYQQSLGQTHLGDELKHLSATDVFERLLAQNAIDGQEKTDLQAAHQTLLSQLYNTHSFSP